MNDHYLTLVDENDNPLGYAPKYLTHSLGLRHRAFSVFIFDEQQPNHLLLQQRDVRKYHCPSLWSNTCCSHPKPNETIEDACARRIQQELNIDCTQFERAGILLYEAELTNSLVEFEYDHIVVGFIKQQPISANPDEVMATQWKSINEIKRMINERPEALTPWFHRAFFIACQYLCLD